MPTEKSLGEQIADHVLEFVQSEAWQTIKRALIDGYIEAELALRAEMERQRAVAARQQVQQQRMRHGHIHHPHG